MNKAINVQVDAHNLLQERYKKTLYFIDTSKQVGFPRQLSINIKVYKQLAAVVVVKTQRNSGVLCIKTENKKQKKRK